MRYTNAPLVRTFRRLMRSRTCRTGRATHTDRVDHAAFAITALWAWWFGARLAPEHAAAPALPRDTGPSERLTKVGCGRPASLLSERPQSIDGCHLIAEKNANPFGVLNGPPLDGGTTSPKVFISLRIWFESSTLIWTRLVEVRAERL